MFDTNTVAKNIKEARIGKNMTQMDLADAMGVSYQAVSNWERGNSMPDISKIPDLCKLLDLDLNRLPSQRNNIAILILQINRIILLICISFLH